MEYLFDNKNKITFVNKNDVVEINFADIYNLMDTLEGTDGIFRAISISDTILAAKLELLEIVKRNTRGAYYAGSNYEQASTILEEILAKMQAIISERTLTKKQETYAMELFVSIAMGYHGHTFYADEGVALGYYEPGEIVYDVDHERIRKIVYDVAIKTFKAFIEERGQ